MIRPRRSFQTALASGSRKVSTQQQSAATPASSPLPFSKPSVKGKGDISDVFPSLAGDAKKPLPARFRELKRRIVPDGKAEGRIVANWRSLLGELRGVNETIKKESSNIVPELEFSTIKSKSASDVTEFKSRGTGVIRNVVDDSVALAWKQSIREYVQRNKSQVSGFPKDDPQVFELYWSPSQIAARSHPSVLQVQKFMSSLWRCDTPSACSLSTPIAYADRLRIRYPGDSKFALGPHIDGGSLERWEDDGYRSVYGSVLGLESASSSGAAPSWKSFDPYDITPRLSANQDLYGASGGCSVLRSFQGWLSMSTTGPKEGTLRVYPSILHSVSYLMLRPFFSSLRPASSFPDWGKGWEGFLHPDNWRLDLDTPDFPGAEPAKCQELNSAEGMHPHLELDATMVSMKQVRPGDMVFWHCDAVHSVESVHAGRSDSSVMYIPSVPATLSHLPYVAGQRSAFLSGSPPPDFPGGEGESGFEGRTVDQDIGSE